MRPSRAVYTPSNRFSSSGRVYACRRCGALPDRHRQFRRVAKPAVGGTPRAARRRRRRRTRPRHLRYGGRTRGPARGGKRTRAACELTVLTDIDRYGYDVIVGTDILAATRVLVDPATHLVRFGVAASHDATILPLSFSDFVPLVDVHLGDIVARLLLDTGDESGIDLSSDFYTTHPDAFVPTQERSVAGVGGESSELLGRAPYVELGGLALRDQPIGTTRSPIGAANGRLGVGFLRQFSIVLDYANRRVELLKSTATQANGAPTSYP